MLGEWFTATALGLPESITVLQNASNHSLNDIVTSEKTLNTQQPRQFGSPALRFKS